ncbi:lysophospholipid acyltransferase family protein [Halobacteriovorax sp. HLS]|uniref:lysophospholipid acyltransferase family protein n=1 Tax=Halobacteriovorax sp. HLS TaxID=2234000 RepID=UPI000FDB8039|nr:lysophospholipid acyltransferase family protein [Halobacteriovorax sp. HLS]
MLKDLLSKLHIISPKEDQKKFDQAFSKLYKVYGKTEDPWGLNLHKARKSMEYIYPLYKDYFKVRVFGKENVQDQPYIITSNHSGQIAIDGMLISTAFAMDVDPPRILRAMVERFFTGLPFVGTWAAEGGAVLGDRQNCIKLLEKNQSVLVFPEGVRGVSKSTPDYYKVQSFTKGFFRIALSSNCAILPVAVIGAEETFPYVYQAKSIARMLGLPALPISANYLPLPSPIDIYIGKPYELPKGLNADSPDKEINQHIFEIESTIQSMVNEGLKSRREFWANVKK